MEDILYTGPASNLAELITRCPFSAQAFVLLERVPPHIITNAQRDGLLRFARLNDVREDDLNSSTSGRIFQSERELRWEKVDNTYWVTYLGKEPEHELPGLTRDDTSLSGLKRSDELKHYYLFGKSLEANRIGLKEEAG